MLFFFYRALSSAVFSYIFPVIFQEGENNEDADGEGVSASHLKIPTLCPHPVGQRFTYVMPRDTADALTVPHADVNSPYIYLLRATTSAPGAAAVVMVVYARGTRSTWAGTRGSS